MGSVQCGHVSFAVVGDGSSSQARCNLEGTSHYPILLLQRSRDATQCVRRRQRELRCSKGRQAAKVGDGMQTARRRHGRRCPATRLGKRHVLGLAGKTPTPPKA